MPFCPAGGKGTGRRKHFYSCFRFSILLLQWSVLVFSCFCVLGASPKLPTVAKGEAPKTQKH